MAKKYRRVRAKSVAQKAPRKRLIGRGQFKGKTIMDATQRLSLKVQKSDIVGAKPYAESCAAARALMRQEHPVAAFVYRSKVYIEFKDHVMRYTTPSRLRQETISHDRGTPDKFMEGDYELLPPSEHQKLGAQSWRAKSSGGKDKRKASDIHPTLGVRPEASRARLTVRP